MNAEKESLHQRIIAVIRHVPHGCVATYGQIAALAGAPKRSRYVGWVLNNSPGEEALPWHRIINSQGRISLPKYGKYELQKALLLQEGIAFNASDRIDLNRFQWQP